MLDKTEKLLEALPQDQILGTMPSGLFLVDTERHIVYWNHEAERITGYSATEAIGQHCSFLEGIECGRGCGLFDEKTPEKPIVGAECRIRTRQGDWLTILKNIDFLRKDGEIVGGIESFIDITRQKNLEESLRQHSDELEELVRERTGELAEERNRLRSVLDAMNDPAYIVTDEYRINFFNRAMSRIFGQTPDQLCYEVMHGRQEPCEECPWERIATLQPVNEERTFGQNQRTYEIVHTPVYTEDGELQKLAVCRDITERKEAAEKLMELNQQLDSFVYTVSHDLRSPLTPIIGFAEFLKEDYRDKLDNQAIELLQEIENQGERMLGLMEDLLELSRVGRLPAPDQPVDTNAVLDKILLDNQADILDKNATVSVEPLPPLLIPDTLLYELFSNLLRNALNYGCKEGGKIEIGGATNRNELQLYIRDHGPGIPDAEKEKVCNVFYRGTTSAETSGTGIGLATVHKIVRLHNGNLRFSDTAGGGCTVTIRLPLPDEQD